MTCANQEWREFRAAGRRALSWPCAAMLVLSAAAASAAERRHGPHVHGVGQLNVAIEGTMVEMELIAPGADIVGFEHRAETPAEREAVEKAVGLLTAGAELFTFPADAGCGLREAAVESALLPDDRDEDEDHAEFRVHYRFHCTQPDALNHVDVGYFRRFPAARELEVQFITARGQARQELTPASARLRF